MAAALASFLFGLGARARLLAHRPYEGDERIFQALVENLDAGRGYTLRGHPILEKPWLARDLYDRPVFHHPPGGIFLFRLAVRFLGEAGWAAVELLGYLLFFAGVLGLAVETGAGPGQICLVALLAALTPVVAFAGSWFWLDVPMAGIATVSAALFLHGVRSGRLAATIAAGLLLGAATWVRSLAFLAAPGAVALAASLRPSEARRAVLRPALWFLGLAVVIHLPWTAWHAWKSGLGAPLPTPSILERSRYVRIIAGRSAWSYAWMLPQAFYTLLPSALVWAALPQDRGLRRRGGALLAWVAVVVGVHMALGLFGFPKVMRYVILAAPACLLLAAEASVAGWRSGRRELKAAIAVGLAAEGFVGLQVLFDPIFRESVFFDAF